tara:strand:+ start:3424 stop:4599 length:1176 start_codon:yes stop_codon:yes gene_type:complete
MKNSKKFIKFGDPCIGNKETKLMQKVLKGKWIGTGPLVQKFEKNFSKYKKSKFSISVNSCTAALHLSIMTLGLKKGDEIITTPMTFCSTINSILLAGCKPVISDINMQTLNIDENLIEKKITKKTKAILIVHFAGLPCNMKKILQITKKYKLKLIEDCAHAIESEFENKKTGNFGDTGCFSFYSNKNITTGEGGMIITNNKNLTEKLKILRLHGLSRDAWKRYLPDLAPIKKDSFLYDVKYTGYKYNMIDLQAAMGVCQLNKINSMWMKRKKLYSNYLKGLKKMPVFFQNQTKYNFKHGYHLFVMIFDKNKTKKNRNDLIEFLRRKRIGASVHYRSVTEMSNYKKLLNWKNDQVPVSYYIGQNTISLPLYPDLSFKDQRYIISEVKNFFNV